MGDIQGDNADECIPEEWDNFSTFLEIRKKRNTVIAAFYAWENTGVEHEALGNLLLDSFVNKWQLLGGEASDSTQFFGTLVPRHQGALLRTVIKVSLSLNLLSYANLALNNLGGKSLVTITLFPLQNFSEIFAMKEDSAKLDLSRDNQFTKRILEASRGQFHDTCLLKLGEALLGYDIYTHTHWKKQQTHSQRNIPDQKTQQHRWD
ncbi:hypothetical protein CYMTET_6577 [Cymbomonas tetramitiformis]|uniref:Uncharacterized protein n=1 Tax=Cymbomonas tetramitiformis TaxID=36881 RepID=A0AAE0GWU4_9CHLO|nr:hypothetical protein CYMTET_10896 [Cymbomonas tetramitiformis]KAK3285834.1 hypothetical protein CYMTET_6577 [Cymbomonas tetramitiformis]